MSKHKVAGTADPDEDIFYADEMVIDEGGIDLKVDGASVLSASFDGVDLFQLAYEVLPEDFEMPELEREQWLETLDTLGEPSVSIVTDEDLELLARLALTALARRKGYEK